MKPTKADAELLIRLYELRREPEMRKARGWYASDYKPGGWEETKTFFGTGAPEDRYLRMVTSYWDMVAAFVRNGILNEDLFFQTNGEDILVWNKAKVWVPGRRTDMNQPFYLKNLESVAIAHQAFREKWKGPGESARPRKKR